MSKDERDEPHVAGPVVCRVCSFKWVAVVPESKGMVDLECRRCGRMAGDAEEEPEAGDGWATG